MSNYVVTTNFTTKDALPSGNAAKIVKGADFGTEFNNIATMSTTKVDTSSNATLLSLILTGNTVPTDGIYLPGTHQLGFATNSTLRATCDTNGLWSLSAPTATGVALTVTAIANSFAELISAPNTSGQSFGLSIRAGTTNDQSLLVNNAANNLNLFYVQGNGEVFTQEPPAATGPLTGTHQIGYLDIPINAQTVNYTFALTDRGKNVQHQSASAHTFTIPANASVAFPIGTTIEIINTVGGGAITLAITTDTLVWLPSGSTGSRTLTAPCSVTIQKINSTTWYLSGNGIT